MSYSTVALVLPISTLLSIEWYNVSLTPRMQSCVNNSWALHYRSSATTHVHNSGISVINTI